MAKELIHELGQNFIEYAVAVNTDRAIPDAKSGLKPVARRILYGAYSNGHSSSKAFSKCAYIVGEVMAQLHPHGDSSIYGALVRLAQPWILRYPLIDFHGNMGNIGGDGPAAYRYTEARLSKITEEGLLAGVKKNAVPFMPNYDEKLEEPVTLPSIFPNLLCNPNTGIGVAIACNWACHNLTEVGDAIKAYLNGEEPMLPGPDFPTGGIVINKNDIPGIMRTGHGTVKIRAKHKIEGNSIVFYEIPYGTQTETIMKQIGDLCDTEELTNISEIRDESNKNGIRIVVQCDGKIPYVLNQLFLKTDLQSSFSYNQVALVNKTPVELNLKDCIKIYVDHNIECIINEAKFDREKAALRKEIIDGLLKALEDIDNIITLIKKSESAATAKVALIEKYHFSDNQAKAILDMKLAKLANLEKIELQNEGKELEETLEKLNALISTPEIQKDELISRLNAIVKKFGDARRTELTQIEAPKGEEKEIVNVEPEKCVVIMSEGGLVKRVPSSSYRTQRRNGKGVKTANDITNCIIRTNTIDSLMVFTNQGRMYRILVDDIPAGTNSTKGQALDSLIEMQINEKPTLIYSIYRDTKAKYVMFVTKKGIVKKTALEEYIKTKKKNGIAAISLKDGDDLASVFLTTNEDIILLSKNGISIRFNSLEVGATSRATAGVKGMALKEDDYILTGMPIRDNKDDLAVFTATGLGKKMPLNDFINQHRGGKGVIYHKPGNVAAAALVSNDDSVLVTGSSSSICIAATEIPEVGKASNGNIIIKGDIKAATKI